MEEKKTKNQKVKKGKPVAKIAIIVVGAIVLVMLISNLFLFIAGNSSYISMLENSGKEANIFVKAVSYVGSIFFGSLLLVLKTIGSFFSGGDLVKCGSSNTYKCVQNYAYADRVGAQTPNACAQYAYAYVQSILNYGSYKTPGSCAGCGCTSFGLVSSNYSTERGVLTALYRQIKNGKPAAIYVARGDSDQHYIAIIGFNKNKTESNIELRDFYMIDPVGKTKAPVSSTYHLKRYSNGSYKMYK